MSVHVVDHPLVHAHLAVLREVGTGSEVFRASVGRLTTLLACAATAELPLRGIDVTTPLATTTGQTLARRIGVVPILRAGLGMVPPILDLVPDAAVWHLGYHRDEETHTPVEYYHKLDGGEPVETALVVDPMLATGGSAVAAVEAVRAWGVEDVMLLSILAAPEGVGNVEAAFPDLPIHVCAVDDRLDDRAFIVPGLGDAGDRIFNTEPH